jgi:hypothetical protein
MPVVLTNNLFPAIGLYNSAIGVIRDIIYVPKNPDLVSKDDPPN